MKKVWEVATSQNTISEKRKKEKEIKGQRAPWEIKTI